MAATKEGLAIRGHGVIFMRCAAALVLLLPGCTGAAATRGGPAAGASAPTHASVSALASPAPLVVPSGAPFPAAAAMDRYLSGLAGAGRLRGAVLVASRGMVFARAYGPADLAAAVANTTTTMFRLGSVSKQFAALGILLLQERHLLDVHDPVCRYVPSCPDAWRPITLENLLTHTSGIPDYINVPDLTDWWTRPQTQAQLVDRFRDLPLLFVPGSTMRYSNSNYTLLGYIIAQVSGQPYPLFLQRQIFDPLAMTGSGYDTTTLRPGHAQGYYADGSRPAPYDMTVFDAAGALYSNLADMLAWDRALTSHRLISAADTANMFAVHVPCPPAGAPGGCTTGTERGYGYGWFIAAEPQGPLYEHLGHIDGYFTFNGIYPQHDLDIVILANQEGADAFGIARTLAGMI